MLRRWLRERFERNDQASLAALESSKADSVSVTPPVILHKNGMVQVPALETPNLKTDTVKLE